MTEPTFDGLRQHLFGDLGFTGDRDTYHDPRNSLLPDVLDRRLGIPITLAVLAIEVGRRCGVALVGVGMPGHFVARSAAEPHRYLDAFDGGRELDREGCRAVLQELAPEVPWSDAHLIAHLAPGDRDPCAHQPGQRLPPRRRSRRRCAAVLRSAPRAARTPRPRNGGSWACCSARRVASTRAPSCWRPRTRTATTRRRRPPASPPELTRRSRRRAPVGTCDT